jgi:hypothetical protein
MKSTLTFLLLLIGFTSANAQFPGTDSLRNYNNKYITNNPATAFTNLRLNTLLRGIIDWVDTARAGTGGGGLIGVDTLYSLNDSTIRYRKNGVFRNVIIKGVYDYRRKVDTIFSSNDTTINFTVNGIARTLIIRGKGSPDNSIATGSRTATGDYIQDWANHWFFLNNIKALNLNSNATDPNYPGNHKTFSFYSDSTAVNYPLWLRWSLRNTANNQDSVGADLTFAKDYWQFSNYNSSNFANVYASGNLFSPNVQLITGDGNGNVSNLNVGSTEIDLYAQDSIRAKLVPAAAAPSDSMVVSRNLRFGLNTLYKVPVPTGGGGGQTLKSDLGPLSETKIYSPAQGVASSSNYSSNYSYTSVDSARYKFSTTRAGISGTEYGGWLAGSTSGDSIKVTSPFWVVFGDSQAEGHGEPTGGIQLHGRLHPAGATILNPSWPDSVGQLSYHLRVRTNMRWYNHGIGGQTTVDCRKRFYRDVLGMNSPNSTDGRTDQTLSRMPEGVVIIIGINDVFNGIPQATIQDNLEWMASVCQQYGRRCVILNLPGDAVATQGQLQMVASINKWLASGVMDQYGACVVDYNSWWNDPAYDNDNIHHTTLIYDDVHPTRIGYDSLSAYIVRSAKLPVLKKLIVYNDLDPGGFTGFSRPTSFTINGGAYSVANAVDSVNISSYVPDSVWLKVTASTNVTGTTYSGFSHLVWKTDNNPNNDTLYTKRTLYSGSQKSNMNGTQLTLVPPTAVNGYDIINIPLADLTTTGFKITTYAGGARQFLGGNTIYNSASLNINNSGVAIGTNGSLYAEGFNNTIGRLHIMVNGNPSGTDWGTGISVYNTSSSMLFFGTQVSGASQFKMSTYNGGTNALTSTMTNILDISNTGFGNAGGADQEGSVINIAPVLNQTTTTNNNVSINGIRYAPIITSLGNARHRGFFNTYGNNYFNSLGDSTCFGCDSNAMIGTKFRVNSDATVNGYVGGVTQLRSNGTGATISGGTAAGSLTSLTVTGSDAAGKIDLTVGTSPSGTTIGTVTFNTAYASTPTVILTPGNAAAAALSGNAQVYVSSISTTNFVVSVGSTSLSTSTQYIWYYHVIQ